MYLLQTGKVVGTCSEGERISKKIVNGDFQVDSGHEK